MGQHSGRTFRCRCYSTPFPYSKRSPRAPYVPSLAQGGNVSSDAPQIVFPVRVPILELVSLPSYLNARFGVLQHRYVSSTCRFAETAGADEQKHTTHDSDLTVAASGNDSHQGQQHQVQKNKVEDHLETHVNGEEANRGNGNLRMHKGKGTSKY